MKPATLRYLRHEQDVWALLWRLMPRAMKDLHSINKRTQTLKSYERDNTQTPTQRVTG